MDTPPQMYEDNELKANEQLFENIKLLNHNYSFRDQSESVLEQHMFLKENRKAFILIVCYLSSLRYMPQTQEVSNIFLYWAPSDHDEEIKLSEAIIKLVTKLNDIFKHANIPIPVQSQLVNPAGLKIVHFLLKWSELCLFEHLTTIRSVSNLILYRVKPNRDPAKTEIMLKAMHNQTTGLNIKTRSMIDNFHKFMDKKKEAAKMIESLQKIFRENDHEFERFADMEQGNDRSLQDMCDIIKNQIYFYNYLFDNYSKIFNILKELSEYLISEDIVLKHDKTKFNIPEEIRHIFKKIDTLDLFEYFTALRKFLKYRNSDLPVIRRKFLNEIKRFLREFNEFNVHFHGKCNVLNHELEKLTFLEDDFNFIVDYLDESFIVPLTK